MSGDHSAEINSPAPINIVMIQESFQVGDIRNNADKIIEASILASEQGADLVIFPELALVGYPPEDLLHRQGFLKQTKAECKRIQQQLAQHVGEMGVVLGLPIAATSVEKANLYNAAVYVHKGEIKQIYVKQLLPNYSVFDELRYFVAGYESGIIEVKGHKIGLLICEDVWQPEYVEQAKNSGAQVIVVLNASPFHLNKHRERIEILQRHAKQFELSILYLNMTGGQDELVFDGDSLAINKTAELVARAKLFEKDIVSIQFDGNDISSQCPILEEDSGKAFLDEAITYKALVTGVRDFVRQNGFSGVIIGLSGGVDSALTLAIAVDALGAENVQAVMMPSRYTADMSLHDAQEQAKNLGVKYDVIEIENIFNQYVDSLSIIFDGAERDTTEENLQARCRGMLLMAISNKTGRMVLTTGNKSEMAVGYATLYGDMCGGFAPIKDVCKTWV